MTTIDITTGTARVFIHEIVRDLEQRINDATNETAIDLITEQAPEHAMTPDSAETDELVCTTQDALLAEVMTQLASLTAYPKTDD